MFSITVTYPPRISWYFHDRLVDKRKINNIRPILTALSKKFAEQENQRIELDFQQIISIVIITNEIRM